MQSGGTSPSFLCFDGQACAVSTALGLRLAIDHPSVELLPCRRCPRQLEADIADLEGMRLGRIERRILTTAPPPGSVPVLIPSQPPTHAGSVAQRRAQTKLADAGLILIFDVPKQTRRTWRGRQTHVTTVQCAGVTQTPLGSAVVKVLGATLTSGAKIRWEPVLDDIAAEVTLQLPELLQLWLTTQRSAHRQSRSPRLAEVIAALQSKELS